MPMMGTTGLGGQGVGGFDTFQRQVIIKDKATNQETQVSLKDYKTIDSNQDKKITPDDIKAYNQANKDKEMKVMAYEQDVEQRREDTTDFSLSVIDFQA